MYNEKIFVDNIFPFKNQKVKDEKIKIKAHIKTSIGKIKKSQIKLYLDSMEVLFKFSHEILRYKSKKKLSRGKHRVLIEFLKYKDKYEWEFYVEGKEIYEQYRGNLHSHTKYSSGQGTPMEAFKSAKDNKLDFLAITDHFSSFKNSHKWEEYKLNAKEFNKKNSKLIALYGMELSIKGIGHLNILNYSDFLKDKGKNLKRLFNELQNKPNAILCINHPGKNIYNFKDKLNLNKNIRLIEVGNGNKDLKYNRYEKEYYKLLDCG